MPSVYKKILDFNQAPSEQQTQLNIAWGVDKNFMLGAAISMTSVLLHNKDLNIHFHLFTDYIDADYQQRTAKLAEQFATNISIYIMDANGLKMLPSGNAGRMQCTLDSLRLNILLRK